jgi:hypothetical protein
MIGNISKGNMLYQKEQGYNQTRNVLSRKDAKTLRENHYLKGLSLAFHCDFATLR